MIKSIKLKNLLSFGDPGLDLELKPLNVLIGPNGSGKSNLIDAISLLQAAPRDIAEPIRRGGGIAEWIYKGSDNSGFDVEVSLQSFDRTDLVHVRHAFSIGIESHRPFFDYESIEEIVGAQEKQVFENGDHLYVVESSANQERRDLDGDEFDFRRSAVAQLQGSNTFAISWLLRRYESIRIYRDWAFGRHAAARQPQRADERNDFLTEEVSNLGLVINRFRSNSATKKKLQSELRNLRDGVLDFEVSVHAGTVQLLIEESGGTFPSTRLSDGTLRYLALLAVLCDPEPPRIVCIEEPELGLHPDLLPHVARLMVEASERCQIIATTHSDVIVDALTDHADAVVVCDRSETGSIMRRLDAEQLKPWLEDYRLGQLWSKGELGGNRW
jgi:predicted ATPase